MLNSDPLLKIKQWIKRNLILAHFDSNKKLFKMLSICIESSNYWIYNKLNFNEKKINIIQAQYQRKLKPFFE